jgi:hypothetical protein
MTYMEPPYVHAPVCHCLGKVLLDAGGILCFLGANRMGRVRRVMKAFIKALRVAAYHGPI